VRHIYTIHIYTIHVCACVLARVCMCVCVCPVKYEHARVKSAIDRGKRREKEMVRTVARVRARVASPFEGELQESALSTPESSYVPPVPTVFLDAPVSICLVLFSSSSCLRENPRLLCAIASAVGNTCVLEIAISAI